MSRFNQAYPKMLWAADCVLLRLAVKQCTIKHPGFCFGVVVRGNWKSLRQFTGVLGSGGAQLTTESYVEGMLQETVAA